MEWWKKTIVYECYVKSFKDTTNNGIGDIQGIISKLDVLKKLGVGAIWLTPVFKSPMVDNGYDVSDYMDIDPSFGSMKDMEELISKAKEKDMKIILDLVFNHTSNQHPWFLESKKNKTNSKKDWYIWKDAKEDGSEPTNWRAIFGGSAWTYCKERNQYYLHTFADAQPDLNWANPEVRKAIIDITNFWIDKGVGGFRIDAITYIKKPEYKDGPSDSFDGTSHIHPLTANTDGILDYLHEFRNGLHPADIFMVGESNGVSAQELPAWVGMNGVFEMVFEFSHVDIQFQDGEIWYKPSAWTLKDLKNVLSQTQQNTKLEGWTPVFFENHDQPRSIDHFFPHGTDSIAEAKLLATILYTLRGTPFIYQGEELGLTNISLGDIDSYNDISSIAQYHNAMENGYSKEQAMAFVKEYSRDNARQPMCWDTSMHGGFTKGTPWLKERDDYHEFNVAMETKNKDSVLNCYYELAALRKEHPSLVEGTFEELCKDSNTIFAYERKCSKETTRIFTNWTNTSIELPNEFIEGYECIFSTKEFTGNLLPYEAIILKKVC